MYKTIVLSLDGSPFAESAAPMALSLARRTGARLRLLSVLETFSTTVLYSWEKEAIERMQAYLAKVAGEVGPALDGAVETKALEGPVVQAIQSQEHDADLIVMATHGRGGFARVWLGSVTDAVVRHAEVPILLVPWHGEEETNLAEDWAPARILLPLDGTETSEAILDHALELGSLFGAVFHLIRVVPHPSGFSSHPLDKMQENRDGLEDADEEARRYLKGHGDRLRARGISVEEALVGDTQPAHGILAEAERSKCDLIAISAHSRNVVTRAFLGSTSDKVVRGAHNPVLVYRRR